MKLYGVSNFVNTPSRSRSRWPRIYTSPLLHAIQIKKRSILSVLPPKNKLNLYCNKLNQVFAGYKKLYYSLLTTIPVSFKVKPVCVWNEILGSCFLCSICCWTRKWGERLPSLSFGIDHPCNRQICMRVEDLPALSYRCVPATSSQR